MKVKEIMSCDVITVKPTLSIHELAELFIEKDISGAPVVDEQGRFLGIVSEEGVIFQDKKVHLPTFINVSLGFLTLGAKNFEEEVKKVTARTVKDIIEEVTLTVSPDANIEEAATLMIDKGSYYLPVLEQDKLVGVVTKKDIVKAIAKT